MIDIYHMRSFIYEFYFSTIGQAFAVAHKMKAKNLLLTHFSQRYPKIPSLNHVQATVPFALAFDHMEVLKKLKFFK